LAQVPEFAEFASDNIPEPQNPGGTMLGGWASSVVEDEEDLPGPRPPRLPQAKDSAPSLPKPKQDGPALPRSKSAGPSLPKPKSLGLPKPKSSGADLPASKSSGADLPASKSSGADLPASKNSGADLPASKDNADLPISQNAPGLPRPKSAGSDLPASKGSDSLPASKAEDALPQRQDSLPQVQNSLPQAKGEDALPQRQDSLPQAKGEDALPQRQDSLPQAQQDEDDLFDAPVDDEDDLFGSPGTPLPDDDDEDDLFGAPADEEEDLFGAPDDEDEDDLFGAPDDEDEDDLFGGPADDDDLFDAPMADDDDEDLFAAPVGDEDSFGAPAQNQDAGALGDDDSEDLFAAPADEDEDDLFEDGGLESDGLFGGDGGGGGGEADDGDDFLSGDSNFSFLDDSPPESGDSDDDLAGKSGEWGDDLMGNAPADDAFDTGRFDDSGGGDSWDDEFGDDGGTADEPNLDDDDPFRPASSGPRQPASQGMSAQTTRDEAVEEDKKRGLMTMIGVPVLALLVLGGAGYGLYQTFFAGPEKTVETTKKDTGPVSINLEVAATDNYGDLQATIDKARKGTLADGEEPKLLLVESVFLTRYDDPDIQKHAKKIADKYADASSGWGALARGAFEAQNGSADAARSYLEPLVGEPGDVGYYAQLMMGVGDVLALQNHLGADENNIQPPKDEQKEPSAEEVAGADAGAAPQPESQNEQPESQEEQPESQEVAQADAGTPHETDSKGARDEQEADTPDFDDTAKQLASRGRTALLAAAKARPKAPAPKYWLGQLYELGGDRKKATTAWTDALEASPGHVASRVALGAAYYSRGDLNKATEHLEKFLAEFSQLAATQEQARAHHLIGRVHSARQRSEEAIKSLTQALSLDASRTDTIQALAEQYMAAEKYQEALNFFTTNKNLGKNNPDVMLGTMRAYMGLEDWDKAVAQLEEGEKVFPNDARFPLYLGRLNRERGAFFDAQKALQRAVEIDPQLLSAHAALAQLAWKVDEDRAKAETHIQKIRKQPEEIDAGVATEVAKYYQMSDRRQIAEQWYNSALDHDPNYWPSRLALARMYLESGEDEKALRLLERAKEEGIQDIRLSAYLADAYRQSERFAKAVDQINEVIESFPKNQEYIFIRGRIYFDQGNFDTARGDFNKAYELDPRYHDAYFFVGRTAFEQGDYKKAMKIFRHVLDYKPNEGEFRYWMGRSYEAEDRLTQALEEYRKATAIDPAYGITNPQLYVRRGRLLSRLGYSVEGKRDIARALELRPDMLEALIAMGESNYRDQLYDEAIENFEKVLEKDAELPEVQYKMGMSLMHTGKELEGAKYLQNAVRFGYDDPEVFQTLGYLYKRMNRNSLAIKSFKEYLKRIGDDERVPVATKREMIRQIEELGGSF
jgi:tetratricopeptide (TPR) repeat protein